MGKTTAAAWFAQQGCPVIDADAEVHRLYAGAATPLIEAAFPGTTGPAGVDRAALAAALAHDPAGFARLEAIVHPLVRHAEARALARAHAAGHVLAVVDIPLLFEIGGDELCDATLVVTAPAEEQRRRVLARPGMTEARLAALLARQLPDAEKRRRATYVVDTSGPLPETGARLAAVLAAATGGPCTAIALWRPYET